MTVLRSTPVIREVGLGHLKNFFEGASVFQHATGRGALYHLTKILLQRGIKTVLLPTICPEGAIQPFSIAGFEIHFYDLEKDLSPGKESLESACLEFNQRAILIVIDYFGLQNNTSYVEEICNTNQILLLRDFAQTLAPKEEISGCNSLKPDFILFSLNKTLPVVDGAILLSNNPDFPVDTQVSKRRKTNTLASELYLSHLEAVRKFKDCESRIEGDQIIFEISETYERYYTEIQDPTINYEPTTQIDFSLDSSYIEAEIALRRSNFSRLNEKWPLLSLSKLNNSETFGATPFAFPALVSGDERRGVSRLLLNNGIMVSSLYEKWDHIPIFEREKFIVERSFLDRNVMLPIGSGVDEKGIDRMLKILEISYGEQN